MTIIDLMTDPKLLGPVFGGPSWAAWRVLLKAAFGLALTDEELPTFRDITGRTAPQLTPARELWLVIARRAGKSIITALIAIYALCFKKYRLSPGEIGLLVIVAPTRWQCRVILNYVVGLMRGSPLLAPLIASETKVGIELTNGLRVEVVTASYRSSRGHTVVGTIVDEIAFLPTDDAAQPDTALLAALRPAMATVPGALLVCLSSPYARRGELWRTWQKHYGKTGDPILVAQADSQTMNPTLSTDVIEAAYEQDDAAARSEWGAEFRSDLEELFPREALEAVVVKGRRELPPIQGAVRVGVVDPSGGSLDAFTSGVARAENGRVVLEAVREVKPPFSPEAVVQEFAAFFKSYGVSTVYGDRYAGEWPRERFRVHGITYELLPMNRSELYLRLLPLVNSGRVELLDNERLLAQLAGLERRTSRAGRDSIDHAPGAHDNLANAAAGALVMAEAPMQEPRMRILFDDDEWAEIESEVRQRGGSTAW